MKIINFPLARITLGFLAGIILAYHFKPTVLVVFSMFFTIISIFIGIYFLSKRDIINPVYFGFATYFLSIIIGATTQIIHTDSFQTTNYSHNKAVFEKPHLISVIVREKLRSSAQNDRSSDNRSVFLCF